MPEWPLLSPSSALPAGVPACEEWGHSPPEPAAHPAQALHPGASRPRPPWGESPAAPLRQLQGLQRRLRRRRDECPLPPEWTGPGRGLCPGLHRSAVPCSQGGSDLEAVPWSSPASNLAALGVSGVAKGLRFFWVGPATLPQERQRRLHPGSIRGCLEIVPHQLVSSPPGNFSSPIPLGEPGRWPVSQHSSLFSSQTHQRGFL